VSWSMMSLALAVFPAVDEAPANSKCRRWGPERAACIQATPHHLETTAEPAARLALALEDVASGRFLRLPVHWLGSRVDDRRHANPDYDDGEWSLRPTRHYIRDLEAGAEVLWFRLHLDVAPQLAGEPLAFAMPRTGAAEVYVDGRSVFESGRVGEGHRVVQDGYGRPFFVTFERPGSHVIAVRWSAVEVLEDRLIDYTPAFRMMIGRPSDLFRYASAFERDRLAWTVASAAFPFALGLLHLCLWFFRRRGRGDWIYASFALSVAVVTALPLTFELVWSWSAIQGAWSAFRAGIGLLSLSTILFHLHLAGRCSARNRGLAVLFTAPIILLAPVLSNTFVFGYALLMIAAALVILAGALRRPSARIHAVGIVSYALGATVTMLGALDLVEVGPVLINAHAAGLPVLLTAMAVALSWEVGETHRALERHAVEVDRLSRLEVEQERKLREQEVARVRLEAENQQQESQLREARAREGFARELETAYARLRRTQTELVESKRSAAVVKLVAGLSHELGSPLGALRSSLDVLERCGERLRTDDAISSSWAAERTLTVQAGARESASQALVRLEELAQRLRTFVQLDEGEVRDADLHEGLDAVIELGRPRLGDGIRVLRRFGAIPSVRCRPQPLHRVFAELLDNAADAIRAKGGEGTIEIATGVDDGDVVIAFEDDGRGMTEEERSGLFDAGFKQGRRVEMGIGLLTAHRTVTAHGGTIRVRSHPGQGARFEVRLPVRGEPEARTRG